MIEEKNPEISVTDLGGNKIFPHPRQKKIGEGLWTPHYLGMESNFKK